MPRKPGAVYTGSGAGRPPKASPARTVFALVLLCVLMAVAVWKWMDVTGRLPGDRRQQAAGARQAALANLDQVLSHTVQDVPPTDVVVNSAVFVEREGKRYLSVTMRNQSNFSYTRLRVVFETYDRRHNRVGNLEGEVARLAAGEEARFEIGPAHREAQVSSVFSIQSLK